MVSKQCEQEIETFNRIVDNAIKKIDEANKRATKAEDILKIIKDTAKANFKKAYTLGYETAKREMNYLDDNNESSGGKEKEEETKLVLKPD